MRKRCRRRTASIIDQAVIWTPVGSPSSIAPRQFFSSTAILSCCSGRSAEREAKEVIGLGGSIPVNLIRCWRSRRAWSIEATSSTSITSTELSLFVSFTVTSARLRLPCLDLFLFFFSFFFDPPSPTPLLLLKKSNAVGRMALFPFWPPTAVADFGYNSQTYFKRKKLVSDSGPRVCTERRMPTSN